MDFFLNLDIFSVGIVVAATVILGAVSYFNNKKSISNRFFLIFVIVTILWTSINYASYKITDPTLILFFLRAEIYLAVWLVYSLYMFVSVFPEEQHIFNKFSKYSIFLVIIVSLFNFTPFVFRSISSFTSDGHVATVQNGPGIAVFGMTVFFFLGISLYHLIKKIKQAKNKEKKQLKTILLGIGLMFFLILIFNFIFPAFFNNASFIAFGGVFIFPFIIATSYAMVKQEFLNIKVLTTEIVTFLIAMAMLLQIFLSTDFTSLLYRFFIFLLVLSAGILLIRSIRKEILQREKLEQLTQELQSANVRLKQLDEAKTEFLSITSHQLRTPLSAIKGYLSMLEEGDFGKLSKKQADIMGILLRNSERLIRLINIFLNISRIESGRLKITKSPNDLNKLINDIIKSLQIEADQKHIHLDFKPIELPMLPFDSDKLSDVILNLVDNAIKYTPLGGTVAIAAKLKDNYMVVSVHDNGIGIAYEELDQLFEKFRRGKEINKVDTSGNGLGLYIAKKIIEGHGGNIWAESEGENKGSIFKFTLPLTDEPGVDI